MKRVIIVGASYAGLNAVRKLVKNEDVEIVLFDKNSYHYIQVESYGYIASKYKKDDVTINIEEYTSKLSKNIKFHKRSIISFDSKQKIVIDDDNKEYSYDKLIIATGSLTNFPPQVPNIKKYSKGIKTLQIASEVENVFSKILHENSENEKETYNVVIGGAGLSGIEIASEMAYLINSKKSANLSSCDIKISIVDGMKTVLPGMDERLVKACKKRVDDLSIKTYLGSFIKDVDDKKIYLTNDTILSYDYFIFTGGVKAVTLNSSKEHEVNKINQYLVNEYLQLKNEEDIFVIGDAAQIIIDDKYYAPTAQIAGKSGEYVATLINSKKINKLFLPFSFKSKGVLVALGGTYAIGLVNDKYYLSGFLANCFKSLVTNLHKMKFRPILGS